MLKRFLPDDLGTSLRTNAIGIAIFVTYSITFLVASAIVLNKFDDAYSSMSSSSWVSSVGNGQQRVGPKDKPRQRYDVSNEGVKIPPSREDRRHQANGDNKVADAEHYRRDCYENAYTLEESDLCAQWSNAAAVRFGNRIALESFRLNSWIGFITAFGVLLAAIGVVLAGLASIAASRSVSMMAYGFMPALSFSVQKTKAGWIKVTVRNAGTGPAVDIRVTVGGKPAAMEQDRLGAGSHATVECRADAKAIEISAVCLDLSKKRRTFNQGFVRSGIDWVLSEEQPENA